MKRKTLYTSQRADVDCEYDINFSDLLELIESCSTNEKNEIFELIDANLYFAKSDESKFIIATNLYDENKLRVLKVAFDKYSLEELQEKLNIKNYEY